MTTKNDINELECGEVYKSFQYFLESYCWIEDKISNEAIPFKLWPAQVRILFDFLTTKLLIILKARQLGLTWLTAAYCLWISITTKMYLIIVISAKEDWAIEFLDRVRFIRSRLPAWMVPDIHKDGSQHMLFVYDWGPDGKPLVYSEIKSLATTVEGAQSKTPDLLVMDETARNRYAKQIFASSKPGIDKAGGRIIVISNSHKDGTGWGWTRQTYQKAITGLNNFKRIFMPWWDCPERSKSFKADQIADGMDEDDFSQQYPATEQEAVSAMMGSYFGKVLQDHNSPLEGIHGDLEKNKDKDHDFIENKRGVIEIWRFPYMLVDSWDELNWTHRYAVGSDISEGLGKSYSVAYVHDRHLDEIVCRMRSNKIDAYRWGDKLYQLSQWYDNAIICPEITGAGQTTVKRLKDLNANMYVKEVFDKTTNALTKQFGWQESNPSKHLLCGDLKQWLRATRNSVYCQILVDECSTYIRHEGGVLNPEDGKLGDCVIAAGCMVQATQFIEQSAKPIQPEPTGWLKREREKGQTSWAL